MVPCDVFEIQNESNSEFWNIREIKNGEPSKCYTFNAVQNVHNGKVIKGNFGWVNSFKYWW